MIVVSDTTPLISFLKINKLHLFEKIFGKVIIPQAVFEELTKDIRFSLESEQIVREKFIVVENVHNTEAVDILRRATGLDKGESESIVLADELKADLLLMDEAKGRDVSIQVGHQIMGTIGVLMAAYEEKLLSADDIKECINNFKKAGRHIGQRYYNILLKRLDG